ncbi:hypothetical protein KIW84_065729 [Lathyrus oleraceus]|uniref:Uncharacterized protein n=1 Tax=Pisum sativum TaxID=3888 RepID=A0A9D5AAL9_PEA|nr:hypothetical protein KIW84_065729 [Pisum sativum]
MIFSLKKARDRLQVYEKLAKSSRGNPDISLDELLAGMARSMSGSKCFSGTASLKEFNISQENAAVIDYPTGSNRLLIEKQQQQFFEITDPEATDTAVPAPTVAQNDVFNNGRPVRQRALPHRLRDYERFQDNEVNNDGDFVHFALMAESEPVNEEEALSDPKQP